jgi:CHAT domain-containing protein/Tfp pilus assembly protein PilF
MKTCNLLSPLFITTFFIFNLVLSPALFGQSRSVQDTVIARQWLDEAKQLTSAGKYEEAYIKADSARLLYAELIGERTKEVADAWDEMGSVKYWQRKYDEAISLFEKALEIRLELFGENHEDVIKSYNNIGNCYFSKFDNESALEYHRKVLEIRLEIFGERHEETGTSYRNIGTIYDINYEFQLAIQYIEKALGVWLEVYGESHEKTADCYEDLGALYNSLSQLETSLMYHEKALEIRINQFGENHRITALSFGNIGRYYKDKGKLKTAIDYFNKVLKIFSSPQNEDFNSVAQTYQNIGNCYFDLGDAEKARQHYEKALFMFQKIYAYDHPKIASILNNIANSYSLAGDHSTALVHHEEALKIRLNVLGEDHFESSVSYYNIAICYHQLKMHKKAIDYLIKGLEVQINILGVNHPEIADFYVEIAANYISLSEFSKADEYLDIALNIWKNSEEIYSPSISTILSSKAQIFEKTNNHQRAEAHFKSSCESLNYLKPDDLDKVYFVPVLIKVINSFAQYSIRRYFYSGRDQSRLFEARQSYKEAFNAIDYLFSTLNSGTKVYLSEEYNPVFSDAIQTNHLLFNETQNPAYLSEAFTLSERSKAYLLYEAMHEANALHVAGIPDSLLEQEYNLRVDMAYYDKRRQETLASGAGETDTTVLAISSKLFDVRNQHDALKHHLETAYPEYYRAKYDLSVISVEETQQNLLRPGEALLEYFVGDSAVYAFVVRPDTFAVYEIPKDFDLDALVAQLREGLYGYHSTSNRSDTLYVHTAQGYAHAARQLYERLIAPVQPLLPKRIFIVPDGVLGYVPFEALLMEKPAIPTRFHSHRYFGKEHVISYAYSATLLREMREKKHRKEPKGNILAMAPFYRGDARKLSEAIAPGEALLALRSDTLSPLPHSGDEALRIARAYSGKHLLGREATKAAFEREAADYRILHLSTHGVADDRVGDYAWLGFARSGDESQFEKLYVRDIYNLSLNADLVVLSACQAGIGKLQRGEGIISLSRAFAYAGAKGIITTLWSVDDKRTKDFMLAFYGHLRKMPAAEALWQTRHDFLTKRTGEAAHPYFWAGFIGVGDM